MKILIRGTFVCPGGLRDVWKPEFVRFGNAAAEREGAGRLFNVVL